MAGRNVDGLVQGSLLRSHLLWAQQDTAVGQHASRDGSSGHVPAETRPSTPNAMANETVLRAAAPADRLDRL